MDDTLAAALAQQKARKVAEAAVARQTEELVAREALEHDKLAGDLRAKTASLIAETTQEIEARLSKLLTDDVRVRVEAAAKAIPDPKAGTNGTDGQGFTWRGAFRKNATYQPYDVVLSEGSTYVSIATSKGERPPGSAWNLMARKGADGKDGRSSLVYNAGGGGSSSSGSGLPAGGEVGQVVVNTAPGEGEWGQSITGQADGGRTGATLSAGSANGERGGNVQAAGGDDPAAGFGAAFILGGASSDAGHGGDVLFNAGAGNAGDTPGGAVTFVAGNAAGDGDGGDIAFIPGSAPGAGAQGRMRITSDGSTGTSGQVLTAQGDGTAEWAAGGGGFDAPDAPVGLEPADYLLSSTVELIPPHTYSDGVDGVGATVTENATGPITTSALASGGSGYAVNDTFVINVDSNNAEGIVDTVSGDVVLTYHLTNVGTVYLVGSGVSTGATSGVGTGLTIDITAVSYPALTADGASPMAGDRIVFYDGGGTQTGVYVVTEAGTADVTPWVLTRATDCDTPAKRCRFWAVAILAGAAFAKGAARVTWTNGTSGADLALSALFGHADGYTTATGEGAHTEGVGTVASGESAHAEGNETTASGNASHAEGGGTTASGQYAHAEGSGTVASGRFSHASGFFGAIAYGYGQWAHSSSDIGMHTLQTYYNGTTSDTPQGLFNGSGTPGDVESQCSFPDYKRTAVVRGTVVARRTDVIGTDAAWSFEGLIRGDGSTAYSWVGGSPPTATSIAADAGASTWDVEVGITDTTITLFVTGENGKAISWAATVEIDELSLPS